jgi:hypothetical protein
MNVFPWQASQLAMQNQGGSYDMLAKQNQWKNQALDKQIAAQQAPLNWEKEKFNTIWPWLQGQWGKGTGGMGQGPAAPQLPSSTVYSPQMQQEMINSAIGQSQGQSATNIANMQQQLAGKGFAANSPLAQALAGQQQAAAMAQGAQIQSQIPQQVAQANAQQGLAVGGLANQLYGQQISQYLGQLQNQTSQQNAMLAALAGMI